MKQFLPVVWWLSAALIIAFVLVGLGYLFADALLIYAASLVIRMLQKPRI